MKNMNSLRRAFFSQKLTLSRLLIVNYSNQGGSKEHIEGLIKGKPIVVFMKGTPDQPRCGFSNAVVQILRFHGIDKFDSFNVLEDENLRQGIKDYTHWPTIPQVFINGEFIGGCDILMDMHKNGELIQTLEKIGIHSTLLKSGTEH